MRRSGFIGDKLYSIADDSVKVVDIADPDVVIAQLTIPSAGYPDNIMIPIGIYDFRPLVVYIDGQSLVPPVLQAAPTEDPLDAAIKRVRHDLADRLHGGDGEPLFVTAEASPTEAGGYSVVFQVQDQNYLYHANADGSVQLADANYHFSETVGVWHAVDARVALSSTITPVTPVTPGATESPETTPPDDVAAPEKVAEPEKVAPEAPATSFTPVQAIASNPDTDLSETPAPHLSASYFVNLSTGISRLLHHRSVDEAFQHISSDFEGSRLNLLMDLKSRSHKDREAQFDNGSVDPQAESSDCDLSDVDNAFESIATLRTATKSHGRSFASRR